MAPPRKQKSGCQKRKGAEAVKAFTASLPKITDAFSKRQSNSLNRNEQSQSSSENVISVADDQGQNQNVVQMGLSESVVETAETNRLASSSSDTAASIALSPSRNSGNLIITLSKLLFDMRIIVISIMNYDLHNRVS